MPSPHILVVDDEPSVLRVLTRMLEKSGYPVTATEHGAPVLEICRREPIGLLLLDYRLRDVDSMELLQQLRQEGFVFPVILMSGLGQMYFRLPTDEPCLKHLHTLSKPFTDEELQEAVQQALAGAAA